MWWEQCESQTAPRVCFFIKKGNADTFLEQLQQFNEFIKQEWVNTCYCSIDFQSKEPRIILILDNASFHKRQDISSKISQELPNFRLDFLPAYSPDYNIIELVWHSCKEYIAHRLFQSVDELKLLLDKLLNQGELVIKWHRQTKNKANNYHVAAWMFISLSRDYEASFQQPYPQEETKGAAAQCWRQALESTAN